MLSFIQSVNRSFHIRVSEGGAMMMKRSCKPFSAGSWGSFLCPSLWGPKAADGRVVHSRVRGHRTQVGGGYGWSLNEVGKREKIVSAYHK